MLDLLRRLQTISTSERGCTRIAYTEAEQTAHDLVWEELWTLAGLVRVEDAAGNMFVVPESAVHDPAVRVVLAGSHLDTVIEGGWLDGTLGVVAATHALHTLAKDDQAHPAAGLVVFRDEEGVRFNTGLFGSSVFAGLCTDAVLDVKDRDGIAVRDVVPDPAGCLEYVPPVNPAVFLECHIEQGLRLIDRAERVGVVTGIVGIRRFLLQSTGVANHAGTTDMVRRRDALVPVARVVSDLPSLVDGMAETVVTCGRLSVAPGAANIVPGSVDAVIEIRGRETETIDRVSEGVREVVSQVQARHPGVPMTLSAVVDVPPMPTDDVLRFQAIAVLDELNVPHSLMSSMAGHDTQNAMHRCPAGMFFIPSIDGISHNPDENSTDEDIGLAGTVMSAWMARCVDALSA